MLLCAHFADNCNCRCGCDRGTLGGVPAGDVYKRQVYNRYPLAAMLHMADLAATYLEERECTDQMDIFWDTVKAFARPVKAPEQAQPAMADAPKPDAETPAKQEMPRGPFPGQG